MANLIETAVILAVKELEQAVTIRMYLMYIYIARRTSFLIMVTNFLA